MAPSMGDRRRRWMLAPPFWRVEKSRPLSERAEITMAAMENTIMITLIT